MTEKSERKKEKSIPYMAQEGGGRRCEGERERERMGETSGEQ
jgi:hypothetical protein